MRSFPLILKGGDNKKSKQKNASGEKSIILFLGIQFKKGGII
jgi:hypothetical protein